MSSSARAARTGLAVLQLPSTPLNKAGPRSCSLRGGVVVGIGALCQGADGILKDRPRLIAVFALPFRVEAGLAELVPERCGIRFVEDQALPGELLLKGGVQLRYVLALL